MTKEQVLRKENSAEAPREVMNNYATAFLAAIAALVLEDETLNAVEARLQLDRIANSLLRGPRRVNVMRNRTNISFEKSTAIYSGALDGICINIKQPESHHGPAGFYCRKGYYSVPVQALVDSRYRF